MVRLASILAVVAIIATACGDGSVAGDSADTVSVGGESLSRSDLNSILEELPETEAGTLDAGATANFLSNWVFITALGQELETKGYAVTQADTDQAVDQLEASSDIDLSTPFGQLQVSQRAIQLAAEPLIEDELSKLQVDSAIPEYLCSSHILVASVEDAEVVGQRLSDGEDFATLAAEVSTGPSGPGGGDLGCVDTSTFVVEYIEGARLVAPAGLTGPVESQFGFHVIDVRSMGPLSAANHPEMSQTDVDSALQASITGAQTGQRDVVVQDIINDVNARITSSVSVDPRYGEWDEGLGIVPPSGVTPAG